jgi:hypothetical protein
MKEQIIFLCAGAPHGFREALECASLLALSQVAARQNAGASSTHSIRFAGFDRFILP